MRHLIHGGILVYCATLLGSCSSGPTSHVREIYEQEALDEVRNPVVVIHGILGAQLRQRSTGRIVWGAFTDEGIDPDTAEGAQAIALSMRDDKVMDAREYDPEEEDVYPSMPLDKIEVGFLYQVFAVAVYQQILGALGVGGYTDQVYADPNSPSYADDHYTCFTFFYDWRRDNVESAMHLGRYLERTKEEVKTKAARKVSELRATGAAADALEADRIEAWVARGIKFDVVAHSMGGLVARYLLRYGMQDLPPDGSLPELNWAGSELIDRLVLVGTPSLGSISAIERLAFGFQPAPLLPTFSQVILGTMPSIYQLLPRGRHKPFVDARGDVVEADPLDADLWADKKWGMWSASADETLQKLLPDVASEAERREIAEGYARWCFERARHFHAAMDRVPDSRPPTSIHLFAGDSEPTLVRARIKRDDGLSFDGASLRAFGDETVPRHSAVADERFGQEFEPWLRGPVPWTNVTFIADDHIGLTSNPAFTNNLLFLLLEQLPQ